jgi:NTP pyrophosphatase (non-canonical NTP hydrolase)
MEKTIADWQRDVHLLAIEKGWYDQRTASPHHILANLMLVVSEISEAAEHVRDGQIYDVGTVPGGKPIGLRIELADAIIRILDTATWLGIDIEEAMQVKHEYNRTRPHKHGRLA